MKFLRVLFLRYVFVVAAVVFQSLKNRSRKIFYLMLRLHESSGSQLSELNHLPQKGSSLTNHSFVQVLFGLSYSLKIKQFLVMYVKDYSLSK